MLQIRPFNHADSKHIGQPPIPQIPACLLLCNTASSRFSACALLHSSKGLSPMCIILFSHVSRTYCYSLKDALKALVAGDLLLNTCSICFLLGGFIKEQWYSIVQA